MVASVRLAVWFVVMKFDCMGLIMGTRYSYVNIFVSNFVTTGKRLKEERERLGYNQTDFAEIGGVGRKSQFNYEEDERKADTAYLAGIAAAGADIRYIVTGDRDGPAPEALSTEERVMLDRYRASPKPLRDAALRVLLGESSSRQGQVFHGQVGQAIKTKTLNQPNLSFFSEKQKKK